MPDWTRLPVCEPDCGLEATVGSINAKDLLPLLFRDAGDFELSEALRPMAHISEVVRVDEVLREMREQRQHVALVHDEHGTVVGLMATGAC